jgi:hypothetical protein
LLFAADSGARQHAIAFFLSLYAFCHLADLRFFVLFPQLLASSASSPAPAEPFRRRRPTLQQHPRPAPRREHRRHSSGRSFSVDGDPGSGSQASALRQQGNFAEELAPLPSSWQHSVSDKDVVKPRAYSTLRTVATQRRESSAETLHQFPSPSISLRQLAESSSRPRWPRLATIFLRISKNAEHRGVEADYRR